MSSTGGTTGEDVLHHSGLLQLDFDHLEKTEIINLKPKIGKDPYVLATWISPSGTGIKAVMRIPADISRHKKIFKNVENYILKNYGKSIDPACSDLGRKCIVSYDEDLIFNENAAIFLEAYVPDVENAENPKKKKIKSEFSPNADQKLLEELLNFSNSKLSKLYLNHVDLEFNFVENGERNKTVIEIVSKLFTIVSPEIILEFLEKYWLQHSSTFVGYELKEGLEQAESHLKSLEASFFNDLSEKDKINYLKLNSDYDKSAFRICRTLSIYEDQKFPPPTFFLSADNLATRIGLNCRQGGVILQKFCKRTVAPKRGVYLFTSM
jgi:hypothetical protein